MVVCSNHTMQRTYCEMVDGWLYWAVFALACRRTDDVVLRVRTAQRACCELWNGVD